METVTLVSEDKQEFTVETEVARQCETFKTIIEESRNTSSRETGETRIPCMDVSAPVLRKVIEFCKHQYENPTVEERKGNSLTEWETNFCSLDDETIFGIILAANYLENKVLLDVACKSVANQIKGKSPDQIRQRFNIKNDFSEEEQKQLEKEHTFTE